LWANGKCQLDITDLSAIHCTSKSRSNPISHDARRCIHDCCFCCFLRMTFSITRSCIDPRILIFMFQGVLSFSGSESFRQKYHFHEGSAQFFVSSNRSPGAGVAFQVIPPGPRIAPASQHVGQERFERMTKDTWWPIYNILYVEDTNKNTTKKPSINKNLFYCRQFSQFDDF
jgi:hypothetical protein